MGKNKRAKGDLGEQRAREKRERKRGEGGERNIDSEGEREK